MLQKTCSSDSKDKRPHRLQRFAHIRVHLITNTQTSYRSLPPSPTPRATLLTSCSLYLRDTTYLIPNARFIYPRKTLLAFGLVLFQLAQSSRAHYKSSHNFFCTQPPNNWSRPWIRILQALDSNSSTSHHYHGMIPPMGVITVRERSFVPVYRHTSFSACNNERKVRSSCLWT